MAALSEQRIRLSSMSPSFLNSNSTSHSWPFSAVAELIDNASDPGVSAEQFWINVEKEGDHLTLTFTDNGSGMTPNKLHKMLSFGFTDKGSSKAQQQAIGLYGNGFKSGSMRLGCDTLIFTKTGGCQTVGMLSQTYLKNIKAQSVITPIVPFNQLTKSLVVTEDSEASLAAILQHSIVTSREQIDAHFDSILSKKGTKILIWNIHRANNGKFEMDFDTDKSDFRLPEIQIEELSKAWKPSGSLRAEQNIPEMHYSLRAYLSILYLRPRIQIILRGEEILAKPVSKGLTNIEHDVYKPHFSKERVNVTFGLNAKNKNHCGIMMYHKNRLIKAYEKVGCQLRTSGQRAGIGIVGIIECNFLKPVHNKQDFEYTKEYGLTVSALGIKLNDYWKDLTEKRTREQKFMALGSNNTDDSASRDPMWSQCGPPVPPESWNRSRNPNLSYRSCPSLEEAEKSQELFKPCYQIIYKKQDSPKVREPEKSSEMHEFKNEATQQIFSVGPSKGVQTTIQPSDDHTKIENQSHTEEEDKEMTIDVVSDHNEETNPEPVNVTEHSQDTPAEKDSVIDGEMEQQTETGEPEEQRLDNDGSEDKRNEGGEKYCNTLSLKRKYRSPLYWVIKKKRHCLGDQTNPLKSSKKDKTPSSREESSDPPRDQASNLSNLSNLSNAERSFQNPADEPQTKQQGEDGGLREAKVYKLAVLEKKVKKLQRRLGLEVTRTSQSTMTIPDDTAEVSKPTSPRTESREAGCQTDPGESSSASASTPLTQEGEPMVVGGCTVMSEPKNQDEQNGAWGEIATDDLSGRAVCENCRSAMASLREVRGNLVLLLTSVLPQLDLAGISLETTDLDHILHQIIEVNELRK